MTTQTIPAEPIYDLWEIPLNRPGIPFHALRDVNQAQLLDWLDQQTPYSRDALVPLVDWAIQQGFICSVQARIPTKGIKQLVSLETFQAEFDTFLQQARSGKIAMTEVTAQQLLQRGGVREPTLRRRMLKVVQSTPLLQQLTLAITQYGLPVAEALCSTPADYVKLSAKTLFRPSQKQLEICGLLDLLNQNRPANVLEIGTNRGGTLYLFARHATSHARLVSVDIELQHPDLIRSFARQQQAIELIEGDSTAPETIATIQQHFPDGLDFVLLDGDHSYEGIQQDYQNYRPLVKRGGMIAFHDIVEDNETRYGVVTGGWAGGVPQFWQELRRQYDHVEFIDDPDQDGLGIGVIFIPHA